MIDQSWIDEIVAAVNEMAGTSDLIKLIREKLQYAYDAGYETGREDFE